MDVETPEGRADRLRELALRDIADHAREIVARLDTQNTLQRQFNDEIRGIRLAFEACVREVRS